MCNFSRPVSAALAMLLGCLVLAQDSPAPIPKSQLSQPVLAVIQRSSLVSHCDPTKVLHVAISLPFANPASVQKFIDDVSNPKSANYRHFITPDEMGQRFGLSSNAVSAVESYLKGHGFKVTLVGKNRLTILADATVPQAEAAFGTTINNYKANNPMEPGNASYFAFSKPLTVPSTIAPFVSGVSGLESFTKPHFFTTLTPAMARQLYNLAPTYAGGSTGLGRKIAISNWDGYRLSNIPLFYTQYGLPTPSGGVGSNVHQVSIDAANGNTGTAGAEGDIDIQMVLGEAPLCDLYIYDNDAQSDYVGVLTREVNDNVADVISESYGWNLDPVTASNVHALHQSMSAQGITYMAASGDSGTSIEPYSYPDFDPEVLCVGGTVATTDGAGNRSSEVAWSSGGGGWSTHTDSFNVLPTWQVGTGVPTSNNHRLVPDVALNAGGSGAYFFYLNGSLSSGFDGTSFACPVFAGGLSDAEQQMIANGSLVVDGSGHYRMGRLQDLIYSQNGSSSIWTDITSGTNGALPDSTTSKAGPGWDYCDGWGAINWTNFVNSFAPFLALSNSTITGGSSATGTVTISSPAGVGGLTVNLSSDSAAAAVPASVVVLQGNTSQTFTITTSNNSYTSITANITATFPGAVSRIKTLKVQPNNRAGFVSQSVPTSMISGQSYPVSIKFKNYGGVTWDTAHTFMLFSANPYNNSNFGMNRMPLTSGPVAPGATGTFSATVFGPSTAGTYNFQWQSYQQSENMIFGQTSAAVSVVVTKVGDAARYISRTGAVTVNAGADFWVQNTMLNVGTNTWSTSTGYSMMTVNPNNDTTWTNTRAYLASGTIAPGANGTFSALCTAPITPGSYTMQWQMDNSGSPFGDPSPLLNITVAAGPDDAHFVSQTAVPTSIGPSATFGVTLTMQNLGTATWGPTYSLVPVGNNNFGVTGIVSSAVVQNANGTFTATFTAPASAGTYTFRWRMADNGVKFGEPSTSVSIVISPDAATYVSRTGPLSVNAGSDFWVQYTMKNIGTNSWSTATGYSMMTVNPNNDTTWTNTRAYLASGTIAPGANGTFNALCTAPITPGSYTMQWQMDNSGTPFGDQSPLLNITVAAGADNAHFVSQTAVPTSIGQSMTFGVTLTMQNLGTATWGSAYSLVSVGNNNFGVTGIVSPTVAPNANGTFTATFTAPATPGTYTFRWRMAHSGVKFGESSTSTSVSVVASADAATYVSRAGPLSVNAGSDFWVQYTMNNIGTTSWSTSTGYSMMTVNPNNDTTWTNTRAYLASGTIAPGANGTFNALCTAPITPGVYTMQWQMDNQGTPFGNQSQLLNITVAAGPDDAQYVTETAVPATQTHSTTFSVTFTMKNLGMATWDGTYSLVPIGSNNFGVAGITSASVAPNANGTFTATFTAPATPGIYNFQWRMAHSGVKFGQPTPSVTITVT